MPQKTLQNQASRSTLINRGHNAINITNSRGG